MNLEIRSIQKRSPTIPKNSGAVLPENEARFLFCPCPLVAARCNYPFRELEAPPWFSDYCLAAKHSSRSSCMRGLANCFSSSTGTPIAFATFPKSRMLSCESVMPRLRMRCFTNWRAISPCRFGSIGSSFQGTNLLRNLRSPDSQVHLRNTLSVGENILAVKSNRGNRKSPYFRAFSGFLYWIKNFSFLFSKPPIHF